MNEGIPDDVLDTATKSAQAAMSDCFALMRDGSDGINWTALLDHFIDAIMAERRRNWSENYKAGANIAIGTEIEIREAVLSERERCAKMADKRALRRLAAAIRKGEA